MERSWIHLCVDMQRMFAEETPWHVPWMRKVSPEIEGLVAQHPQHTVFTRFLPPARAGDMPGMWRDYYEKWWMMTGEHLPPEFVDVIPSLRTYIPPARVFDKRTYSPWVDGRLHRVLSDDGIRTIVLSGGETDVCVLAAALGAVDLGYRVILLKDAVCSGVDDTHDAGLELLGDRFSVQLEIMTTEAFLSGV